MAISLGQLGQNMQKAAQRLPTAVNVLVKAITTSVHGELVLGTPVDVGTARSNWTVALDTPQGQFILAYAPGSHLGRGERANALAAAIQARTAIAVRQPGQTIYIENNAPYIGVLNDGWSRQAAAGFVEAAIITGIHSLDGKVLDLI